jgi:xanthine dehydrogenase YagS FAD-binding subunit
MDAHTDRTRAMRPFSFQHANTLQSAQAAIQASAQAQFLAGGTTLVDLMKLDVMQPETLVDINPLGATALGKIEANEDGLRLGALVRMAEAADHPIVRRDYPAVSQTLSLAASAQLRNMASLGGNVLQRTRCAYFRDISYTQCNKRNPGSGCAARDGFNRVHAILGTSQHCIASYPGDFAQALIAFDARVEIASLDGTRSILFSRLHRRPGARPDLETNLEPGEIITAFYIPAGAWTRRSAFVKVRDRESYEFALASAVVGLDFDGDKVRNIRIALGGVATVPWRATAAETALLGQKLTRDRLQAAADAAFEEAQTYQYNRFKVALGKQTLIRAIDQVAAMGI